MAKIKALLNQAQVTFNAFDNKEAQFINDDKIPSSADVQAVQAAIDQLEVLSKETNEINRFITSLKQKKSLWLFTQRIQEFFPAKYIWAVAPKLIDLSHQKEYEFLKNSFLRLTDLKIAVPIEGLGTRLFSSESPLTGTSKEIKNEIKQIIQSGSTKVNFVAVMETFPHLCYKQELNESQIKQLRSDFQSSESTSTSIRKYELHLKLLKLKNGVTSQIELSDLFPLKDEELLMVIYVAIDQKNIDFLLSILKQLPPDHQFQSSDIELIFERILKAPKNKIREALELPIINDLKINLFMYAFNFSKNVEFLWHELAPEKEVFHLAWLYDSRVEQRLTPFLHEITERKFEPVTLYTIHQEMLYKFERQTSYGLGPTEVRSFKALVQNLFQLSLTGWDFEQPCEIDDSVLPKSDLPSTLLVAEDSWVRPLILTQVLDAIANNNELTVEDFSRKDPTTGKMFSFIPNPEERKKIIQQLFKSNKTQFFPLIRDKLFLNPITAIESKLIVNEIKKIENPTWNRLARFIDLQRGDYLTCRVIEIIFSLGPLQVSVLPKSDLPIDYAYSVEGPTIRQLIQTQVLNAIVNKKKLTVENFSKEDPTTKRMVSFTPNTEERKRDHPTII